MCVLFNNQWWNVNELKEKANRKTTWVREQNCTLPGQFQRCKWPVKIWDSKHYKGWKRFTFDVALPHPLESHVAIPSTLLLCTLTQLAILNQWLSHPGSSLESKEELLQKISAWVHPPGFWFNWSGVRTPVLPSVTSALQKLRGKSLWPPRVSECLTEECRTNIRRKELKSWSSTGVQNLMTHIPSCRNNLPKIALYIAARIFRKELNMWMLPKAGRQVTPFLNLS